MVKQDSTQATSGQTFEKVCRRDDEPLDMWEMMLDQPEATKMFFRDKLMGSQAIRKFERDNVDDEDVNLLDGDVVMNMVNGIPVTIFFE